MVDVIFPKNINLFYLLDFNIPLKGSFLMIKMMGNAYFDGKRLLENVILTTSNVGR